jgi:5-methylcytosine-specific restriction endonuclease McrA
MSGSLGKPLVNELSEFLKIDNDWDFGKTEQACIDYTNRRKQAWEDELKRREQEKIRLAIEAGVPREIVLTFNGDYRDWYHTIYTQSPAWRRKADEVKRRDGYKCRHCGKTQMEIILHAHHLTYKHMGQLIPYGTEPLEDLLTLCSVCHEKEENRKKLQRYLEYVELTRIIQERQEKEKWQRQNNSP